ncbi:hypothetical protein CEW92_08715 [Bacillaceae bacterium SAS-127]|nr:hypothetical protein CEW92_08715 [Bacillaceae bacterium SAS-127]
MYKFAIVDVKKLFTSRLFFLSIFLPIIFTTILITSKAFSEEELNFSKSVVKYFNFLYQYSIILISVYVATMEISWKTMGVILSSLKNRRLLIYTKLITIVVYSLFLSLFLYFSNVLVEWIEFGKVVNLHPSFFGGIWIKCSLFSIFILLFALLIALFLWNKLFTLIIILVSFIFERNIVAILQYFHWDSINKIYELNPLSLIVKIYQYNDYDVGSLLIIISSSLFLLLFTMIKIDNMDIK